MAGESSLLILKMDAFIERIRAWHPPGKGNAEMKRTEQDRPIQLVNAPVDLQEEIRRRAYEIYEERRMTAGSDVEDWLQAEAEIRDGGHTRAA